MIAVNYGTIFKVAVYHLANFTIATSYRAIFKLRGAWLWIMQNIHVPVTYTPLHWDLPIVLNKK